MRQCAHWLPQKSYGHQQRPSTQILNEHDTHTYSNFQGKRSCDFEN